jgi:lsr operon transcriptional repressor
MLGRVAALHYTHGLTHQKIADLLGLSRVQVTRLLAKAREEGIVEIRVHSDDAIFPDLQIAFSKKYQKTQVWIAPSFSDPKRTQVAIGAVAAEYLRGILKPGDTVAVGLSSTLDEIVPHLRGFEMDVLFVPALGSRPHGYGSVNPHEVASDLAQMVGGTTRHLPAPFLMSTAEAARVILQEPEVRETLDLARRANIGLYGVGGVEPGTGILVEKLGSSGELQSLLKQGAVGDMSGVYFDKDGKSIPSSAEDRIVGLRLNELLSIPHRIAVAGGKKKVRAIAAAAKAGIITTLITDIDTAQELLLL